MQDYYYTLGVSPDSSADEIKAAYKKLAPKFHPDKNGNDHFFTERFKEIQHAYETLADTKKRQEYNLKREKPKGQSQTHYGNNFTPEIDYFRASSPYFEYDTEITFSWKTINVDRVTIKPFGNVPPIGQKTVKFKDFKIPELTFDLLAENSTINRHVAKNLTIYNKTYQELSNHFTTNLDRHTRINNQTHHESPNTGKKDLLQIVLISIALILFFIAIIILNSEVR